MTSPVKGVWFLLFLYWWCSREDLVL